MANYLQEAPDKFHYVYSCELNIPFRIKMCVAVDTCMNIQCSYILVYARTLYMYNVMYIRLVCTHPMLAEHCSIYIHA